jgi:hypothetical protein
MSGVDDNVRAFPSSREASDSLAPVVGQILFMPLSMMIYGLNLLARTTRGLPISAASTSPSPLRAVPAVPAAAGASDPSRPTLAPVTPGSWSSVRPAWRRPDLEIVHNADWPTPAQRQTSDAGGNQQRAREELNTMSENKSLQDDMLKTVRYWVAFEKRDFETILHEDIDQVYDNLTDAQFTAWKMAEFVQQLAAGDIKVPYAWRDKKKRGFFSTHAHGPTILGDINAEDKKYLTVDWEVVGRVQRRKGRFEERKTEALEEIAESISGL